MGILHFKTHVYYLIGILRTQGSHLEVTPSFLIMLTFWNDQDIRKPFRGDSKHREDQAAQGCPPIRIKEK